MYAKLVFWIYSTVSFFKLNGEWIRLLIDNYTGLPVQVRDSALKLEQEAPNSDINRQYYAQNMSGKVMSLCIYSA